MSNEEYQLMGLTTGLDIKYGQALVLLIRNGKPAEVFNLPYYDRLLEPADKKGEE